MRPCLAVEELFLEYSVKHQLEIHSLDVPAVTQRTWGRTLK